MHSGASLFLFVLWILEIQTQILMFTEATLISTELSPHFSYSLLKDLGRYPHGDLPRVINPESLLFSHDKIISYIFTDCANLHLYHFIGCTNASLWTAFPSLFFMPGSHVFLPLNLRPPPAEFW